MEPTLGYRTHTLSKFALACPKNRRVSGQPRGVDGDATNDLIVGTPSRQRLTGGVHREETDQQRREIPDDCLSSAL